MCGIAGFLDLKKEMSAEHMQSIVQAMADTIQHRGPDDGGIWYDSKSGVALGSRRLAVIDLSPLGHQPMFSASKRYAIVYNGEIYNYQALREELAGLGHTYQGSSDTEVMLAAFCEWGIRQAVEKFNGMFAFAVWDQVEQTLYLARDRMGEKPLYYGWLNGHDLFGSELKALQKHPAFTPEINREALVLYLRYAYIPAPYSIYQGIYKLPPATLLTLRLDDPPRSNQPEVYWPAKQIAEQGFSHPFTGSEKEILTDLDALLRDAVKRRMIADVPLGAFLSGGIDSSTIVALMQAQSDRPVRTFTIGFHEAGYDEAKHAWVVARHLGTDHTELYVTPEETRAVIPRLPTLYDEPFADSSQIPTFLIAELARRHVTVSLSGDGGDELFGGYNRYFWGRDIWNRVGWMPGLVRRGIAGAFQAISPTTWDRLLLGAAPLLPSSLRQSHPGEKLHKLAECLGVDSDREFYLNLVSFWRNPSSLALGTAEPSTAVTSEEQW